MNNQKGGITINFGGFFLPALCLVFVIFKLMGELDWSWWWVMAPMWGPFAFGVGIFLLWFLIWLLFFIVTGDRY